VIFLCFPVWIWRWWPPPIRPRTLAGSASRAGSAREGWENYTTLLTGASRRPPAACRWDDDVNSLIMAMGIAVGKIAISICRPMPSSISASPSGCFFFWMIFITLMLPVEVRILPTYEVSPISTC
jgi:ABC-type glycerol-3-phosphate transport system permease component